MQDMQNALIRLVAYGRNTDLLPEEDEIYTVNRLLELFEIDELQGELSVHEQIEEARKETSVEDLEEILKELLDGVFEKGILKENSVVYRDLFDTKIMSMLLPRPGEVIRKFRELYAKSPKEATDYYYKFSGDTDYIRRYRIKRDMKWEAPTGYGDHPARQNHRIIPIQINGEQWGFQYSPYVYYNEHCIVFNGQHVPMKIDHNTFCKLFDFVKQFPHYILGSNADLPIVGGSILTHDHFQGGNHEFPMAKAPVEKEFIIPGYEDVEAGIVKWPMSVIRLKAENPERIIALADVILDAWRGYTDEAAFIYAETDGEKHNTITPIARKKGDKFELDLVLRNNITTQEHPLGVYHPHANLHHIKKENIGLIEVMGLAVLPARLRNEMEELKQAILADSDLHTTPTLSSHAAWTEEFLKKYPVVNADNVDEIIQKEIGLVFMQVLTDAGVYKRTPEGMEAFERFIKSL